MRRPSERRSSIAYSSARRFGGAVVGRVEPSWKIATGRSRVALARIAPMMFGFGRPPKAF